MVLSLLGNKTAVITGSSRGIGLAIAEQFVNNGAKVVISSEQSLTEAKKKVSSDTPNADLRNLEVERFNRLLASGKALYVKADMGESSDIKNLVDEAWKKLGTVDVLVNNAGIYKEPSFLKIKLADFLRIFKINFLAPLQMSQEFVRRRIEEGKGGRLLFTTSINAERSEPLHTLYDASKAAVNGLVRQLAIELAPKKFTTMGIAAGLHATSITDYGLRSDPQAQAAINSQIPLGIGTAEHVAPWFAFAASDAASYSTGTIINVDGGLTPQQMPDRPVTAAEGTSRTLVA